MELFIGTKTILAKPMTRAEYNQYRGWEIPSDENPNDEGYLVEYLDSPEKNHPDHDGYISWSPKNVFDNAYKASGNLSFSQALEALKQGKRVCREGWNGKGMWLKLIEGREVKDALDSDFRNSNGGLTILSHIDMFTAKEEQCVGWLASQTDMLANDWCIL